MTIPFQKVDQVNRGFFQDKQVNLADKDQRTGADGILGLAPNDPTNISTWDWHQYNVLDYLKAQDVITHKVFSIYTSLKTGNASSHIKFGGYDDNAIKPGSQL